MAWSIMDEEIDLKTILRNSRTDEEVRDSVFSSVREKNGRSSGFQQGRWPGD